MTEILNQLDQVIKEIEDIKQQLTHISQHKNNALNAEYLNVKELANYIKLSREIIYRLIGTNTIPHFKIKNTYLFIKKDIDNWVLNCLPHISFETVNKRFNKL